MGQNLRQDSAQPLQLFGFENKHEPAQEQGSEHESERAQSNKNGHLCGGQPLGRIGSVAHHCAREDRGADVVRQGVGGERTQGDEHPRNIADAEMQKSDTVVPGERRIGDDRRNCGQPILTRCDRLQIRPDLRADRLAFKTSIKQPAGSKDRDQPHNRPQIIEGSLDDAALRLQIRLRVSVQTPEQRAASGAHIRARCRADFQGPAGQNRRWLGPAKWALLGRRTALTRSRDSR